jgi:hypothetical protein
MTIGLSTGEAPGHRRSAISGDPVAALLDRLRREDPAWRIDAHPLGLGLWTAEQRSDDGRSIHYIVCHTGQELEFSMGVVLVVAAALTLVGSRQGAWCNTCGVTT